MESVQEQHDAKGIEFVKEILDRKGNEVWSVTPETTVFAALELMADKNIGALLVIDKSGELRGIFSERDYARKIVLLGKTSRDTPVSDIMTKRVFFVGPSEKITQCMALMTKERIRHLPVLESGKVLGIISIGDVVKSIISKQEFLIGQLEDYIMGRA